MRDSTPERPRGDAAWRAELKEIGKRNDAARAAGARRRAVREAEAAEQAAQMARREVRSYPAQPGR